MYNKDKKNKDKKEKKREKPWVDIKKEIEGNMSMRIER